MTKPSTQVIGEFLDQAIRIAVRNVSDGGLFGSWSLSPLTAGRTTASTG